MKRTPTVGDDVRYVMDMQTQKPGAIRPAKLVQVWDASTGVSNIVVYVDGTNDGFPVPVVWRTSVKRDPSQSQGSWHYAEDLIPVPASAPVSAAAEQAASLPPSKL